MKKLKSFIIGMFLIAFQTTSAAAPEESWGEYLRRRAAEVLQAVTPQQAVQIDPQQAGDELITAALHNDNDRVEQLLAARADKDAVNAHGWTALIIATMHRNKDIVKLLLAAGADVDAADADGRTALMYAAILKYKDIAKLLLAAGAVVDGVDQTGRTAEQIARDAGHTSIADLIRGPGGLTKSAGKR